MGGHLFAKTFDRNNLHFLGFEGLEEAGQFVDHLYVQFYNNYCHTGDKWFDGTLDKWLSFSKRKNGPLIFIGVPAHTGASSGAQFYRTPSELSTIYGVRIYST